MSANDIQHGGDHYKGEVVQHWDFTWKHGYNQFEYCATKYVERCYKKNGLEDLRKAYHHLEKYAEVGVAPRDPRERIMKDAMIYCGLRDMPIVQMVAFINIHLGAINEAMENIKELMAHLEDESANAEANGTYVNQ